MGTTFGYARVSTREQNLEMQIDALVKAGVTKGNIYNEKITGTVESREELNKLLQIIGDGDVLVIYKLDRLGRSLKIILDIIDTLILKGVNIKCISDPIDTTTPFGKAQLQIMAVFAELERNLIVERTRAGLSIAKANGKVLGRKKKLSEQTTKEMLQKLDTGIFSRKEICKVYGISLSTLKRIKNER